MKMKIDKYETAFWLYLALVIVSYVFFYLKIGSSEFQKSFTIIREHSFIILLLLWVRSKINTSLAGLLLWSILIYKFELIAYNIALIFASKEHHPKISKYSQYDKLNISYDIVLILSSTILIAVLVSRYFDKICNTAIKITNFLKYSLRWTNR